MKVRFGVLAKYCFVSMVLFLMRWRYIPVITITGPADCGQSVQTVGRLSYPVDGMQYDPKASDSQVRRAMKHNETNANCVIE